MPLRRTFYSLRMLLRHRRQLLALRRQPARHVLDFPGAEWKACGVLVLALDFDGVLASHGELLPTPEAEAWLRHRIAEFGAENIFILSNKPLPERLAYFAQAGVRCISGVRKKPYPDGLLEICRVSGVPAQAVLMVDDRLLTGGLAACIVGAQGAYVRRPYVNLRKRPGVELFFMSLRGLERLAVDLLGRKARR